MAKSRKRIRHVAHAARMIHPGAGIRPIEIQQVRRTNPVSKRSLSHLTRRNQRPLRHPKPLREPSLQSLATVPVRPRPTRQKPGRQSKAIKPELKRVLPKRKKLLMRPLKNRLRAINPKPRNRRSPRALKKAHPSGPLRKCPGLQPELQHPRQQNPPRTVMLAKTSQLPQAIDWPTE